MAAAVSLQGAFVRGHAAALTTLHDFTGGADGATPYSDLLLVSGVLYGTTYAGGPSGLGTIFAFDIASGQETVLYAFKGGMDGANPVAGLTFHLGQLYGTTAKGGANNNGTVFRFNIKAGREVVLRDFAMAAAGSGPVGRLGFSNGRLFGATAQGGANNDGTVYSVDAQSGATKLLYSFKGVVGASDGMTPSSGLTEAAGAFYGVTSLGGGHDCGGPGCGTVYRYDPSAGTVTIVHAFTATGDGMVPEGELTASRGLLFGTTNYGPGFLDGGNIFQFDPTSAALKSVYAFTGGQGNGPVSGVTPQAFGLYGTLPVGGSANMGIAYKVGVKSAHETTLHDFTGGADGGGPSGKLTAFNGAFYGVTGTGGSAGTGTLYKIVP